MALVGYPGSAPEAHYRMVIPHARLVEFAQVARPHQGDAIGVDCGGGRHRVDGATSLELRSVSESRGLAKDFRKDLIIEVYNEAGGW